MSVILTAVAELSYMSEGILVTRLLEDADITYENSVDNFKTAMTLTGGKRYAAFTDARASISISKEALEYGSSEEANHFLIAQAILITSLPNRILGNFMIKFHKPQAPTKLFSDQEQALKWLREQLVLEDERNTPEKKKVSTFLRKS